MGSTGEFAKPSRSPWNIPFRMVNGAAGWPALPSCKAGCSVARVDTQKGILMKKILVMAAIIALSLPALGQGNTPPADYTPPADSYTPPPASPLVQRALDACPALMERTNAAVANGHVSYYYDYDCDCMARSIDYGTWDEASASYAGPKMPDSDAYIIIGALASAPTIEDAFAEIDSNLSEVGYSATTACYGK